MAANLTLPLGCLPGLHQISASEAARRIFVLLRSRRRRTPPSSSMRASSTSTLAVPLRSRCLGLPGLLGGGAGLESGGAREGATRSSGRRSVSGFGRAEPLRRPCRIVRAFAIWLASIAAPRRERHVRERGSEQGRGEAGPLLGRPAASTPGLFGRAPVPRSRFQRMAQSASGTSASSATGWSRCAARACAEALGSAPGAVRTTPACSPAGSPRDRRTSSRSHSEDLASAGRLRSCGGTDRRRRGRRRARKWAA